MSGALYIHDFGVCTAIGSDRDLVWKALCEGGLSNFTRQSFCGKERLVGKIPDAELSPVKNPFYDNRVNRLSEKVLSQMERSVSEIVKKFGSDRVGVFVGSSDNGSEESFSALKFFRENGFFPKGYSLKKQQADFVAEFIADRFCLKGPVFTHSSACASSASAFASARNWLETGFCDAAIVGGVDIASLTVVLGFDSLEAVSLSPTNPFSGNRAGLTIGEAAAFFVVSLRRENATVMLTGIGESADAEHVTAPRVDGLGARLAMEKALADAGISPPDVDYINLHGTGTKLNDAMECVAVHDVFGNGIPASSTKGLTGHTLGAAGALEAAFCCLALSDRNEKHLLPVHRFDGVRDPALPEIHLVFPGESSRRLKTCISNSFGFGGCNVALVLEKIE